MKIDRFFHGGALALVLTFVAPGGLLAQNPYSVAPPPADIDPGIGENTTGPGEGGLDAGIFAQKPFVLTLAVREGYDDNVFTTRTNKTASWYTNFAAGLRYDFGSPRFQLSANLGGGVTYYYSRPGDRTDLNGELRLSAVYLATPRLTLNFSTRTAYLAQPDLTIVGGTNRTNGDYFYSNTSLSAAYQWAEKFSTVTAYNITPFYYVDDDLNDSQGRVEQTISQSFRFLWKPKTTFVLEYRANPVTYFYTDLDSFGNYGLVGFDQVFNPRFTWTARLGVEQRFNNNPVDGQSVYVGPYGQTSLRYQFGPASSLFWNARYGTEASGLNDVTQRQTFRTGFGVSHAFTQRISATLNSDFAVNYYDQADVISSFYETIWGISLGLNFKVNRFVSLSAGYQFTADIAPEAPEREYTRNVVFVGANFTF
ncbi:MAG: hypothetical protein SFU53_07885 [Terrimicrobiaceae bacterium]|nr:hypothetical protein [Terrimicrobiaceae bacterium]